MVGILVAFWDGLFSGAMFVLGSVYLEDYSGLGPLWQARSEVFSGHRLHETPLFSGGGFRYFWIF